MYLMLDLLYHKRNPFTKTVVDGTWCSFQIFTTITSEKNVIIFTQSLQ